MANFEESCIAWRKSTYSNTTGCVEVAVVDGRILIRDSAHPNGEVLELAPEPGPPSCAWAVSKDSVFYESG